MEQLGTLSGLFLWGIVCVFAAQVLMVSYSGLMWLHGWLRVKREADKALLRGIKKAYLR